jgi:hypothetical protein
VTAESAKRGLEHMKSRQHTRSTRRRVSIASRTKTTRTPSSARRAPVIERAHLSCLLCGRKGDVDVPVGMLLAGAPHELICEECLTRHPTDHNHALNGGQKAGFKIIGRDGDSARVLVVHAAWDPADRRRGLAPSWIFDTKLKKGWGPLPLLAATRSGAWREWSPDDKEMRRWLAGFAAVRKDLRSPGPEQAPARVVIPSRQADPSAGRRTRAVSPKPKAR